MTPSIMTEHEVRGWLRSIGLVRVRLPRNLDRVVYVAQPGGGVWKIGALITGAFTVGPYPGDDAPAAAESTPPAAAAGEPYEYSGVNILRRVERAMSSDIEDQQDQSARIEDHYQLASAEGKRLLDDVFACLCGWSLKTILAREDHNEHDDDSGDMLGDD